MQNNLSVQEFKMFFVKAHRKLEREVVAVCDDDILGKCFEEGDLFFEVKENFYRGEKKNEEEVKKILLSADNLNLVGKKIIKLALELKIIDKENIIKIHGTPHAQRLIL